MSYVKRSLVQWHWPDAEGPDVKMSHYVGMDVSMVRRMQRQVSKCFSSYIVKTETTANFKTRTAGLR
jgi:hypothetical protein